MIRLDVQNDGTGDDDVAHYDVEMTIPKRGVWTTYKARVERHDRSRGWAELMRSAIDAVEVVMSTEEASATIGK